MCRLNGLKVAAFDLGGNLFCQVLQQALCLSTHLREHAHGAVDDDPKEDDYGRKDCEKQRLYFMLDWILRLMLEAAFGIVDQPQEQPVLAAATSDGPEEDLETEAAPSSTGEASIHTGTG